VTSIKPCAMSVCRDACDFQAGLKIWEPEVCTGELRDAGRDGGGAGGGGGCGCAVASTRGGLAATLPPMAMLVLGAAARSWPHRRRGQRGRRP
jgi:hypothetical protein